jgi:predicted acyl esterase
MAQVGYVCLAIDVRGTGNSGGSTMPVQGDRQQRDYFETVEWAAAQEWCTGKVGVWGKSYGGAASLLTAAQNPPHLATAVAFHGSATGGGYLSSGGRPHFLETLAQFGPRMAGWNFMPPGYRDEEGRWLSVWREHLESNVPWMVASLDQTHAGEDPYKPPLETIERIQVPVLLWSGWRDVVLRGMIDTYQALKVPKKLIAGPWMHVLPDVGHAGKIDYLHELQRWFDYWLKDKDTGIMEEPPVAVYVQGVDQWFHEDDFPPPEVDELSLYLGPDSTLLREAPAVSGAGSDSFEYDATVGAYSDFRTHQGLDLDQRPDELKGVTYTTQPLEKDMEICGVPEVVVRYGSTTPETLLAVKLSDVAPDGKSTLVSDTWLDVDWAKRRENLWGEVSDVGPSARLRMMPTDYLLPAGHRLRLFIAGSNFPRVLPSIGPGEISIGWGGEPLSEVILPVRPPRTEARKPAFLVPQEIPHPPVRAPLWRIEHDPIAKTVTVRIGIYDQLAVDGGDGPATISYRHECSATASQDQPSLPSAHAESWARRESEGEEIEIHTVSVYRTVALDMMIEAKLNGAPFWRKQWIRHWPDGDKGELTE